MNIILIKKVVFFNLVSLVDEKKLNEPDPEIKFEQIDQTNRTKNVQSKNQSDEIDDIVEKIDNQNIEVRQI